MIQYGILIERTFTQKGKYVTFEDTMHHTLQQAHEQLEGFMTEDGEDIDNLERAIALISVDTETGKVIQISDRKLLEKLATKLERA